MNEPRPAAIMFNCLQHSRCPFAFERGTYRTNMQMICLSARSSRILLGLVCTRGRERPSRSHAYANEGRAYGRPMKLNEAATTRLAPAIWLYSLVPLWSKERMISKFIGLVTSRHQMSGSPVDSAGSKYGVEFEQGNGRQQDDLLSNMFPTRP